MNPQIGNQVVAFRWKVNTWATLINSYWPLLVAAGTRCVENGAQMGFSSMHFRSREFRFTGTQSGGGLLDHTLGT